MARVGFVISVFVAVLSGGFTNSTSEYPNELDISPANLLRQRAVSLIKNHFLRRHERLQHRSRAICYDMVGCFSMPRSQLSPLKKIPQAPETVDTKFLLLTRNSLSENSSDWLVYGDEQKSLKRSNFDVALPTKIIVHGFKGSGQDKGALDIADAFLKLEDANVVLVDWQKGAAGPSYASAAANTQLVGRQLALLLLDMTLVGADHTNTHIIGFSLGAHIAGYAGRAIQKRGFKVGRITGLDPASPLFRELLATSFTPLSKNDAVFVDVIHTDGARIITEGLGIFRPIGHVDFFPNGGVDQPGCNHIRGAVIASHLGGSLNTSIVCNHLRAWQLFLESLKTIETGCEFWSFPCAGGWNSFEKGDCFPSFCTGKNCSKMGYFANESNYSGPVYLMTRDSNPYCGHQFKVSAILSKTVDYFRGDMQVSVFLVTEVVHVKLHSDFREELQGGYTVRGIGVAPFGLINRRTTPFITAHISCYILNQRPHPKRHVSRTIAIDEITIKDINGNTWRYAKYNTLFSIVNDTNVEAVTVELHLTD